TAICRYSSRGHGAVHLAQVVFSGRRRRPSRLTRRRNGPACARLDAEGGAQLVARGKEAHIGCEVPPERCGTEPLCAGSLGRRSLKARRSVRAVTIAEQLPVRPQAAPE